jgi:hypothetical protein
MKFILPVLLSLSLTACSTADVGTSTTRSSEQVVTVMPAQYAMQTATTGLNPNQQRLTSSNCAKNFDSTISYLEYLMEQEQLKKQSAL